MRRLGHALRVALDHLVAGAGPSPQEPQHLGIAVELDLEVEMPVGERDEHEAFGAEDGLRHPRQCDHRGARRTTGFRGLRRADPV